MKRIVLMAGALVAVAVFDAQPSLARYEGPWCAHRTLGFGFIENRCDMQSYEMCRREMGAQGGTWCTQNPYYVPPAAERRRRKAKRR